MSSGTITTSGAGRAVIAAAGSRDRDNERIARLGLSPRQQRLNYYYSHYRGQCYDARAIDWDGTPHLDELDREAIARQTFLPPGYYDAGILWPLKFRRPTAPYALVKVIVDRFTGLLFSERRHPQLRVDGDPITEDFVRALAEASRLWQVMIQARTFGGACGSAAISFQFVEGHPIVEAHDPRWLFPRFDDRATLRLKALEKRYQYPEERFDPEEQKWVEEHFWYRRLIDDEHDVLWDPVPVGDGEEPPWEQLPMKAVEHGLGFCPAVWIQNMPVAGDVDGDPDAHCIYDLVESIDALLSQANRGVLANSDPTLVLEAPNADTAGELKKGSDNAIVGPPGTKASYLELQGAGAKAAMELAEDMRKKALEVAQCVLEHPEVAQRTATEVERSYASMLARADVMREQYGERGVKPLLDMMVKAARKLTRAVRNGQTIERGALALPDRVEVKDDQVTRTPRRLGDSNGQIRLQWSGYFEPKVPDALAATQAAGEALGGGLIDQDHATRFVSEYFRVDDVPAMLKKMQAEAKQRQAARDEQMMSRLDQMGRGGAK
jgi:hypothetical protein